MECKVAIKRSHWSALRLYLCSSVAWLHVPRKVLNPRLPLHQTSHLHGTSEKLACSPVLGLPGITCFWSKLMQSSKMQPSGSWSDWEQPRGWEDMVRLLLCELKENKFCLLLPSTGAVVLNLFRVGSTLHNLNLEAPMVENRCCAATTYLSDSPPGGCAPAYVRVSW